MDSLDIVMRIVHLASMAALAGGVAFALVAALPALGGLDEGARGEATALMRKRFNRIVHPAILGLLVSGIYQWVRNHDPYERGGALIHALLGIKILLALVAFSIAFASAGNWLPGCPKRWMKINLSIVAVILALASTIRHIRLNLPAEG